MYLDYWQLEGKPFRADPTGPARYACESHEGALHKLRYAVGEGSPAAALAGPSGVGKTLLVRRLAEATETANPGTPIVHLVFPQMSGRELLCYLAERLGAPQPERPHGAVEESVRRLEEVALTWAEQGVRPMVVIDEAHLLEESGALETLRLLTNFQVHGGAAFTLLLVGQMGLLSSVARWPTLDERLAVKTLLRGFTATETAEYVCNHLTAAGAMRDLFSDAALEHLHVLTGGVARRINRLADLALVVGMAEQLPQIEPNQLDAVERELVTVGAT